MENNSRKFAKCEFCEQSFNQEQLTTSFNKIYNNICNKCKDFITSRVQENSNWSCSNYCLDSGKCDNSCEK